MIASRTARYMAFYRALETEQTAREPLFRDPFARLFLTPSLKTAVCLARVKPLRTAIERFADFRAPGARSSAVGRTRFIDDVVASAAGAGSRQLVILGAGFDCRAHRLPELAGSRVFEADRRETQVEKRSRIQAQPGVRSDINYIPVDFATDDLGERLAAAGWSSDQCSTFICEGVSNYLSEVAVESVLSLVRLAAPGSVLVLTYVHSGVLDGSAKFDGADKLLQTVRRLGEPWTFGLKPSEVRAFLQRFGLALEKDLGADQYRQLYAGWWGSNARGYSLYRIAVARVTSEAYSAATNAPTAQS